LTDGPTIFLANDLQKIAKFCIQQANIPAIVMKDIMEKIEYNNQITLGYGLDCDPEGWGTEYNQLTLSEINFRKKYIG
jgi:hypothetical protein